MRLPGSSAAPICAIRFRHTISVWNDWATGDAGMPEEDAKEEEQEEGHNIPVLVNFGGTLHACIAPMSTFKLQRRCFQQCDHCTL